MEDPSRQAVTQESRESACPSHEAQRVPRVAVIGVHGIARHPAGETENAAWRICYCRCPEFLETLALRGQDADSGWDGERKYGPFKAVGIHIPLQRVKTRPVISKKTGPASFQEESALFSTHLAHQLKTKLMDRSAKEAADPETESGLEDAAQGLNRKRSLLARMRGINPLWQRQVGYADWKRLHGSPAGWLSRRG